MRSYEVTIYNQHAMTAISARGSTRPLAFRRALAKAGEPWLREGGDKLTRLRVLFYDHLMRRCRTSVHAHVEHVGCGVEFRRLKREA